MYDQSLQSFPRPKARKALHPRLCAEFCSPFCSKWLQCVLDSLDEWNSRVTSNRKFNLENVKIALLFWMKKKEFAALAQMGPAFEGRADLALPPQFSSLP